MKVPLEFYVRDDVVLISRQLLGKVLCTRTNGLVTKAIITETEAYAGIDDKASHAYGGRRTRRTEPMYGRGGTAYIYLCYGLHHLFNVVTNIAGTPHAVLIRAGKPLEGSDVMRKRRKKERIDKTLLAGPGSLAQALGITTNLTGTSLLGNRIWIEDQRIPLDVEAVVAGPRIGVNYAAEDAKRAYRFRVDIDGPSHITR
ncbi:MAG: DNA-3-methyladenine glycosylase [Planctomycetota bacterium]|jgi:DNA-3-methyladenine glycosylase